MQLAGFSVHMFSMDRLCWTLIVKLTCGLLRERLVTLVLSLCGSLMGSAETDLCSVHCLAMKRPGLQHTTH